MELEIDIQQNGRNVYSGEQNWRLVPGNPTLTADLVLNNLDLAWNVNALFRNPSVCAMKLLLNLRIFIDMHSRREKEPDETLYESRLDIGPLCHRVERPEEVLNIPEVILGEGLVQLYWNPRTTIDLIRSCPDLPWNFFNGVSCNKHLTIDDIEWIPPNKRHWPGICRAAKISADDIKVHPEYPWWTQDEFAYCICENPNVRAVELLDIDVWADDGEDHHDPGYLLAQGERLLGYYVPFLRAVWNRVTKQGDMTLSLLNRFIEEMEPHEFDWEHLSITTKFPLELILGNPHLPWEWSYVSSRDDLTDDLFLR